MNEEWMIDVAGVSAGRMAGGNGRTCHARGTDCRRTAHSGYDNPQGCGKNSAGCIGSAESGTDSCAGKGEADALSGFGRSALQRDRRHSAPSSAGRSPGGFIRIRPRFRNFLRNWWFRGRMRLCSVCMGKKLCRGGESSAQSWP